MKIERILHGGVAYRFCACGEPEAEKGTFMIYIYPISWDNIMNVPNPVAEVDVKHSAPLAGRPIADEVDDTIHRGLASALVVSGAGTGKATDPKKVKVVKNAAGDVPVFIGSGVSVQTLRAFMDYADGFIVGTAFKQDGLASNPVDPKRVKKFMAKFR